MNAIISDCGNYRYWLERDVGERPLVFLMLNPSTADSNIDDPTIRRCKRFSKDNGYTGIIVVNLYAYRATDPNCMLSAKDPVGAENQKHLMKAASIGDVCCAWGAKAGEKREKEVINLMKELGVKLFCLGKTKSGSPKHPLYIKSDQPLLAFKFEGDL